jgi:hypothetical protein
MVQTFSGWGGGGAVQEMEDVLKQAAREGRPLNKAEKRKLRQLYRKDNPGRSVVKRPGVLDEQQARLEYLCRLVVRDRHPFCPVNGVLLLIPLAGTDSDEDAADTGNACQRDVAVLARSLKVHCPLFALVCDMETAPGFTDLVGRFPPAERRRRLGQSCPLVPELRGARAGAADENPAAAQMVQSLADWLCESSVKGFAYRKFQSERGGSDDVWALAGSNSRLFLFFDELQQRGRRLGQILTAALEGRGAHDLLLFGGCYLAGTGTDAATEQAFVRGLFDRLGESQSCVYWTAEARAEEAVYQRWVSTGWALLGALAVLVIDSGR